MNKEVLTINLKPYRGGLQMGNKRGEMNEAPKIRQKVERR